MSDLLDEIQWLDHGSAKQTICEAYKKAHQAIRDGLKAVEESICGRLVGKIILRDPHKRVRLLRRN